MRKNVTLVKATRNSSHLNQKCELLIRKAILGQDYGLANQVVYTTYDYEKLYIIRVLYSDGMIFGDVLVGIKRLGNGIIQTEHISNRDGHSWTMTFQE